MIRLSTPRLVIRDHLPQDIQSHHLLFSDREVMTYLQDIMTHTPEESEKNLALAISEVDNPQRQFYFLRMELKDTGEHLGEVGYTVTDFTPGGKQVHLGYFTHRRFWGQGYMTEAVLAVMRFAFEADDVARITTGCIAENAGSERVMQKCGFIKDPDYHELELHNGQMKQRVQYRLTRQQWAAATAAD